MFNHRLCVQKVLCIRTLKLSFFPWFREKNKSIYKMIFVYNFCATQEFFSHKIQCPKSKSETNEIILLLVCLSALNRTIHKNMFCWGRWEIKDQHKCIGFIIYSINVSLLTFIELTYSVNIWVLLESLFLNDLDPQTDCVWTGTRSVRCWGTGVTLSPRWERRVQAPAHCVKVSKRHIYLTSNCNL